MFFRQDVSVKVIDTGIQAHNHHGISDNLQMTCKRRVRACCNQWSGEIK